MKYPLFNSKLLVKYQRIKNYYGQHQGPRHWVKLGLPQGVVGGLDEEIRGDRRPDATRDQEPQVLAVDFRGFEEGTSRLTQDHAWRRKKKGDPKMTSMDVY